jgi:hypothetical protein
MVNINVEHSGKPTESTNLGGPFVGYSPVQTLTNFKNNESVIARTELRRVWNTNYSSGTYNGNRRAIGPFRAVMNSGDFLSRPNYICGGPNPANNTKASARRFSLRGFIDQCDGTGVPASSCNVKFVADSSDYTKFRRQSAFSNNYNDLKNGGYTNSAYVPLMRVR